MKRLLSDMVSQYECHTVQDYQNALHECIQEIALLGLWRAKFFEYAAFYGGTALRVLYHLDRFSEDLDFSLLAPQQNFSLTPYNQAIRQELQAFGLDADVQEKQKSQRSAIQSAFIKTSAQQQMITVSAPPHLVSSLPKGQLLKIKMEVDTDPPGHFDTETKYLLRPIPFSVNTYTLPNLFAGKVHAILCRSWQKRIKGRDWYDLIWYIQRNTLLNLDHLYARLIQSGHIKAGEPFDAGRFQDMLQDRIQHVDFELAKKDISPFIADPEALALWSKDFFSDVTKHIKIA